MKGFTAVFEGRVFLRHNSKPIPNAHSMRENGKMRM
jgi:hypothetical protein